MKNYYFRYLILVSFFLNSNVTIAEYTYGLGFRLGKFASGPDFKWFFHRDGNLGLNCYAGYTKEAKSGYFGRGFLIRQLPILDSKLQIPLDIIVGAGPHVGYFNEDYYYVENGDPVFYSNKTWAAGLGVLFGLEYDTEKLPITIGIDAIPYYNLLHKGPEWIDFSLSVRYKFR